MKWYLTSIDEEVFHVLATDCEEALVKARELSNKLHKDTYSEKE